MPFPNRVWQRSAAREIRDSIVVMLGLAEGVGNNAQVDIANPGIGLVGTLVSAALVRVVHSGDNLGCES